MTQIATAGRRLAADPGALPLPWIATIVLTIASVAAIRLLGVWAVVIPIYVVGATAALLYPHTFALGLLGAIIAIEPGAFDFTRPVSWALYSLPPRLEGLLPFTVSPLEALIAITAVSLAFRPSEGRADLPALVRLVPVLILLGLAYGLASGGDQRWAYHEARGLIFGSIAFVAALRFGPRHLAALPRVLLAASTVLAVVTIARYWRYVREGSAPVAPEHVFAHESAVFFGIAFVVATALLMSVRGTSARALLVGHNALVMVAIMASGRRSAILMLLVAALLLMWLVFPKRPTLVAFTALPALIIGGAYLVSYWNVPDGALAQPARAVRSQFDPSPRDRSSNEYREDEIVNLTETIKGSPLLGIGFGRPFEQVRELPDLTSFWPLQLYTSHQSILWLWLKMGIVGISTLLAIWIVAVKRCLVAFRAIPSAADLPVLPLVLAAALLMYLAFARVDVAFASTRTTAPLAVILMMAFSLPRDRKEVRA